jgi:hypothetical protein
MPDNTFTIEINGTIYTIYEFFDGKDSINGIIAKRVEIDLDPSGFNIGTP